MPAPELAAVAEDLVAGIADGHLGAHLVSRAAQALRGLLQRGSRGLSRHHRRERRSAGADLRPRRGQRHGVRQRRLRFRGAVQRRPGWWSSSRVLGRLCRLSCPPSLDPAGLCCALSSRKWVIVQRCRTNAFDPVGSGCSPCAPRREVPTSCRRAGAIGRARVRGVSGETWRFSRRRTRRDVDARRQGAPEEMLVRPDAAPGSARRREVSPAP